jgi:amino acid transporter
MRGAADDGNTEPKQDTHAVSGDGNGKASQFNPELHVREKKEGVRPGDTYVRVGSPFRHHFRRVGPGHFVATPEVTRPAGGFERAYRRVKGILIGHPLETSQESHQRLNKLKALSVFGADPISSCAYATEEAMLVLIVAGNSSLNLAFFIALAVSIILSMVAFSYRQTVYAYPQGGGSYNVSRENLGQIAGLVAASALLIDYVLTVSVSIVAGSAAVTSALYASGFGAQIDALNGTLPHNFNVNVLLSVFFILVMTVGNLRGIRESGAIFAIPTYLFLGSLALVLGMGLFRSITGTLAPAEPPPFVPPTEPLTLWLVLRAFSAGAVAMSGTEAISNGVPAFEKPESRNAATTLTIMAALLTTAFLGISYLATHMGLVPGEETIISQVARAVFGTNTLYYIFQITTMGILIVAGNTAFADFPRLASVLARDNYMPHQFLFRGDRLAFSTGIVALAAIASLLVVIFAGEVSNLIHLYAVGVFLAFTLSNAGMVIHWRRTRGEGWKRSVLINGTAAVMTFGILVIVAVTKFALGGWIVVVLIPIITMCFLLIHRHYSGVAAQLRIAPDQVLPSTDNPIVLVPIDDVNYASLRAISFARQISPNPIILHVAVLPDRADKVRQRVEKYLPDARLVIVDSPYRSFVRPLLAYVSAVHSQRPDAFVTIVLPEFITAHWLEGLLHNRTVNRLRAAFEKHPNVAVVLVPYLLGR